MVPLGASPPRLVTAVPGPASVAWTDRLARTESPAFTARRARRSERSGAPQDPIVWAKAEGANVVDVDGNVFVDLTSGFGVAAVGHAHPNVVAAIAEQSTRLVHGLGDLHPSEPKIRLLERLAALAPFEDARVVLGQSGSDAIESALKTAMLHTGRAGVLAFEGSYHGLAHGPLAVSGYAPQFRAPFAAQLNPHVHFAPYGLDPGPLPADVGAIVVEPILGRGGVVVPPADFLGLLSRRAREAGALLIVDEIFTGLGRCGVRWRGAHADLLCVGKALGGGMPVSACIGRAEVMSAWGASDGEAIHTGTFFGHPLGCAAALAALDLLEDLAPRAERVGQRLRAALEPLGEVRGEGLMLGLVPPCDAFAVVTASMAKGYLTLPAGQNVVQIVPPLTIDESLLAGFVDALASVIEALR